MHPNGGERAESTADLTTSQGPPTVHEVADDRGPGIRVVVIDAEPLVRSALRQALSAEEILVVGEAANEATGLALVADLQPDIVLIDVNGDGQAAIEGIHEMGLVAPTSSVLVLARTERNQVIEAIIAGATGYILKSATPETVVEAVKATANGGCVISAEIASTLLDYIRAHDVPVAVPSDRDATAIRARLTRQELEVFKRLAHGGTNREVANELSLSPHTVAKHVASILAKLQLDNRIQAAVRAVRSGIS